jgi:hypothetical protein
MTTFLEEAVVKIAEANSLEQKRPVITALPYGQKGVILGPNS